MSHSPFEYLTKHISLISYLSTRLDASSTLADNVLVMPVERTTADASVRLHLSMFGASRLAGAAPLHLPRRKVKALLAYLVLYPHRHAREELAALFWGDSSDAAARASLRTSLNLLRHHLGNELLFIERETV